VRGGGTRQGAEQEQEHYMRRNRPIFMTEGDTYSTTRRRDEAGSRTRTGAPHAKNQIRIPQHFLDR